MKITRNALGVAFFSACTALVAAPAHTASVSEIYTLQYPADGGSVVGSLLVGPDGQLYGVTSLCCSTGGTVFRVSPSGTFTTLVTFEGTNGGNPAGGLVVGPDGNLYGATRGGGANDAGTIFRVTPGGTLTTLASTETGCSPLGALVAASDGNFYGSMKCDDVGWIFRVTPAGLVTRVVSVDTNLLLPTDFGLAQGDDGNLYGVTDTGGTAYLGSVFRTTLDGTLTTIASMDVSTGTHPSGRLARGADGNLYGVTLGGQGPDTGPSVIRIDYQGANAETPKVTKLTDYFPGYGEAQPLLPASDGNLYDPAHPDSSLNSDIFAVSTSGGVTDIGDIGTRCAGPLVQAANGTMYGVVGCDAEQIVRVHRPTTLQAQALFSIRPMTQQITFNPRATLADSMSKAPVAGRWVTFWAGAKYLCGSWTGPDGVAKCQATVVSHVDAILSLGIRAVFQDDGTFAQSKASGQLICVGNLCLP